MEKDGFIDGTQITLNYTFGPRTASLYYCDGIGYRWMYDDLDNISLVGDLGTYDNLDEALKACDDIDKYYWKPDSVKKQEGFVSTYNSSKYDVNYGGKTFSSKMSSSVKSVVNYIKEQYGYDSSINISNNSEKVIQSFYSSNNNFSSVDTSSLQGNYATALKNFNNEMTEMLGKYSTNLNVMSFAQQMMDTYIIFSLNLDKLEKKLEEKIKEYNEELKNEPKKEDYQEEYEYTDENNIKQKAQRTNQEYYTKCNEWKKNIDNFKKEIDDLEKERDDLVVELDKLEQKLKSIGYEIKDIKPSENLLDFWNKSISNNDSMTESNGGYRRKLTEEEIKNMVSDLYITDNPNIEVYVSTEVINGVAFNVYDVYNDYGKRGSDYEELRKSKLDYLANIDQDVLQYIADYGTQIVMYSDKSVSSSKSLSEGKWSGFFSPSTRNIYLDNGYVDYSSYSETAIHEMGHAFDSALGYNATGELYTYNSVGDNHYEDNFSKSFYETIKDEADEIFDPSNFPIWNYWNYERDGFLEIFGNIDTNHDFSNYDREDLLYAQYQFDEKNETPRPIEYFAEAFKTYYTPDRDKRKRYEFVIPETFEYISGLENMVKGVDNNEN